MKFSWSRLFMVMFVGAFIGLAVSLTWAFIPSSTMTGCDLYIDDINGTGGDGTFYVNLEINSPAVYGVITNVIVWYNTYADIKIESPGVRKSPAGTHGHLVTGLTSGWTKITAGGVTYKDDDSACCYVGDIVWNDD